MSTQTETQTNQRKGFRFPIGGMLSGALVGFGTIILLQQFAVVYPTRIAVIGCVVIGAVIALLVVNLVAATGRSSAPAAAAPVAAVAPVVPVAEPTPAADAADATEWAPTHDVVAGGTSAYDRPDPSLEPVQLDGGLDVTVIGRDGVWAQIRCSNGWTAWVDDTTLQERAPGG